MRYVAPLPASVTVVPLVQSSVVPWRTASDTVPDGAQAAPALGPVDRGAPEQAPSAPATATPTTTAIPRPRAYRPAVLPATLPPFSTGRDTDSLDVQTIVRASSFHLNARPERRIDELGAFRRDLRVPTREPERG